MSSFTKYSHLPRHAEIVNLEHELAVLRERRAAFHRLAPMALRGFAGTLGVGILLFIHAIVTDNSDATTKLFLPFLLTTVCVVVAFVAKGTKLEDYFLASNPFEYGSGMGSHARFVEEAIAARGRRLSELSPQQ